MPLQSKNSVIDSASMLAALLDQLACPACHGELAMQSSRFSCTSCGRSYPIVDGIPVLIADRAQTPGA